MSFGQEDRRVRLTRIGPFEVSTVFLGINHNHLFGAPILFETMTFLRDDLGEGRSEAEGFQEMDGRYSTWSAAERGHQRAVDWLKREHCAPGEEQIDLPGETTE